MAKRQLYTSVVQCGKYQAPRSSLAPLPPRGYMSDCSIDGKLHLLLIVLMVYIRKSNFKSNRITNFPRERKGECATGRKVSYPILNSN